MNVATDFDRERSLEAMWHAYRASHLLAQNKVAVEPGVVRDLLNARYYNSANGQFLSEDPVFLAVGDPIALKKLNGQDLRDLLSDPQQMNAYNYGRANPISKSDPTGLAPGLFSSNPILATLDLYGYVSTLSDAAVYYGSEPKSAEQKNSQKAQL